MLGPDDPIPYDPEVKQCIGKFISVDQIKIENHTEEVNDTHKQSNKNEITSVDQEENKISTDESDDEETEDNIINNVEVEIIEDESYSGYNESFTENESPTTRHHFLEGNLRDDLACYSGVRTKRKKSDPREWRDSKNRRLRELGQNYVGWSRPSSKDGNKIVAKRGVERKERKIGPTCSSSRCRNSAIMQCNRLSESERRDIFNSFWHDMTWDQKKLYVVSLVKNGVPKRRRRGEASSRRSRTLIYNLRIPTGETLRVCKKMFLSTLDLGEWSILSWVNRASSISDCDSQTSEVEGKDV